MDHSVELPHSKIIQAGSPGAEGHMPALLRWRPFIEDKMEKSFDSHWREPTASVQR